MRTYLEDKKLNRGEKIHKISKSVSVNSFKKVERETYSETKEDIRLDIEVIQNSEKS